MRKLRLVKERREQPRGEFHNDLRGINDLELIKTPGFAAHLWLHTSQEPERKVLEDACRKFNVSVDKEETNRFHFYVPNALDGEHKENALRLFFVALSLAGENSNAKAWVEIENSLQSSLHKRIEGKSHFHRPHHETILAGDGKGSCIVLDPLAHLTLVQANVLQTKNENRTERTVLESTEIRHLKKTLQSERLTQKERKLG